MHSGDYLHRGQQTLLVVLIVLVGVLMLGGLAFGLNILDKFWIS